MTASEHPTDALRRFLAAFPEREGGHDETAAREAWGRAIGRANPETLITGAIAYADAMAGRPRRYVVTARRWLDEGRWRDTTARQSARPALVWIALDAPEWRAWAAFYRATKGKSPPVDKRGGWRFPGRFPPAMDAAE